MFTVQGDSMDATSEKIDYMIQCLKVAKAEYEYTADYIANEPTEGQELWELPNSILAKTI